MKLFTRLFLASMFTVSSFGAAANVEAAAFQVGDQGTDVAEIQGELAALGYDVVADGDYGFATVEAVKAFQLSQGLHADGAVGEETYARLLGKNMPQISRGSNYIYRRVIQNAMQYIGVPYVWGGTSPYGFDCSGYVQYVYANAGVSLPRTADVQYEVGTPISRGNLIPGDLVFFSTYTYGASHVGIYVGEGSFIHASSSRGVTISSLYDAYYSSVYIGARRVM